MHVAGRGIDSGPHDPGGNRTDRTVSQLPAHGLVRPAGTAGVRQWRKADEARRTARQSHRTTNAEVGVHRGGSWQPSDREVVFGRSLTPTPTAERRIAIADTSWWATSCADRVCDGRHETEYRRNHRHDRDRRRRAERIARFGDTVGQDESNTENIWELSSGNGPARRGYGRSRVTDFRPHCKWAARTGRDHVPPRHRRKPSGASTNG